MGHRARNDRVRAVHPECHRRIVDHRVGLPAVIPSERQRKRRIADRCRRAWVIRTYPRRQRDRTLQIRGRGRQVAEARVAQRDPRPADRRRERALPALVDAIH